MEFRSSLRLVGWLSALGLPVAGRLGYLAATPWRMTLPEDPLLELGCQLAGLLAGVLMLGLARLVWCAWSLRLILTARGLTYQHGRYRRSLAWERVYTARTGTSLLISDGERWRRRIHRAFFPRDYGRLSDLITRQARQARERSLNISVPPGA